MIEVPEFPTEGPPNAPHLLVLFFDYTCPRCRRMQGYLNQARKRYGDQIAIRYVPVPLDARCNPDVRRTQPSHQAACDYAWLALAVWRADATKFASFHQ